MSSADTKNENEEKMPHTEPGIEIQETTSNHKQKPAHKPNGGRKTSTKVSTPPFTHHRPQPPSKKSPARFIIAVGACILLGGAVAFYTTTPPRKPLPPIPMVEETSAPVAAPVEQPVPSNVAPPPKEVVKESIHPNATIDVPSVGLRNTPDIDAKATSVRVKRGEQVEIVKRHSGSGPEWVKIKTKSERVGWVFASLVKERKAK
jgi:hypothetical protein